MNDTLFLILAIVCFLVATAGSWLGIAKATALGWVGLALVALTFLT